MKGVGKSVQESQGGSRRVGDCAARIREGIAERWGTGWRGCECARGATWVTEGAQG